MAAAVMDRRDREETKEEIEATSLIPPSTVRPTVASNDVGLEVL